MERPFPPSRGSLQALGKAEKMFRDVPAERRFAALSKSRPSGDRLATASGLAFRPQARSPLGLSSVRGTGPGALATDSLTSSTSLRHQSPPRARVASGQQQVDVAPQSRPFRAPSPPTRSRPPGLMQPLRISERDASYHSAWHGKRFLEAGEHGGEFASNQDDEQKDDIGSGVRTGMRRSRVKRRKVIGLGGHDARSLRMRIGKKRTKDEGDASVEARARARKGKERSEADPDSPASSQPDKEDPARAWTKGVVFDFALARPNAEEARKGEPGAQSLLPSKRSRTASAEPGSIDGRDHKLFVPYTISQDLTEGKKFVIKAHLLMALNGGAQQARRRQMEQLQQILEFESSADGLDLPDQSESRESPEPAEIGGSGVPLDEWMYPDEGKPSSVPTTPNISPPSFSPPPFLFGASYATQEPVLTMPQISQTYTTDFYQPPLLTSQANYGANGYVDTTYAPGDRTDGWGGFGKSSHGWGNSSYGATSQLASGFDEFGTMSREAPSQSASGFGGFGTMSREAPSQSASGFGGYGIPSREVPSQTADAHHRGYDRGAPSPPDQYFSGYSPPPFKAESVPMSRSDPFHFLQAPAKESEAFPTVGFRDTNENSSSMTMERTAREPSPTGAEIGSPTWGSWGASTSQAESSARRNAFSY